MSIVRRLLGAPEKRAISYQTLFATGQDVRRTNTSAGIQIDDDTSMKITTVFACVRLLADTMRTLPRDVFSRRDGLRRPYRPRPEWVNNPDPADDSFTWQSMISETMTSLMLDGNAFVHVAYADGQPTALRVLDPRSVAIISPDSGAGPIYRVSGGSDVADFSSDEMLHIPLIRMPGSRRGLSPIDTCAEALGTAAAAADFQGRYFSQGTSSTGVIEFSGDLTADHAKALSDHWAALHTGKQNAHSPMVLSGGATFRPLSMTADQMQLVSLRTFSRSEVLSLFRVPGALVQDTQPGAVSYASVEQQVLSFEKHTIRPLASLLEEGFSRLLPSGAFLRLSMEGLLRGDRQGRFEAYSVALNNGWLSANEIRRWEDLTPIDEPGADRFRMPLNLGDTESAGLSVLKARTEIASRLVSTGYDPVGAAEIAGLDIAHTGVPPAALQQLQAIDPEDPTAIYEG